MSFTGIDAITYGVANMEKARQYFGDWGLRKVRSSQAGTVFETADKSEIILRPRSAKNVPRAIQNGSTVREVVWGVSAKADLRRIEKDLSKDRPVTVDRDGTVHSTDAMGLGIGFRLSRRKPLKQQSALVNTPGSRPRIDQRSTFYPRAIPQRIGHIVWGVPDYQAMEDFYTSRLGFSVSDRYKGRATFMRCAEMGNHHNLFCLDSPDGKPRLNHVAFEVRDIHEVFGGGLHFSRRGWKTEVGPGRHPVSSAYFWYFKSPAGGATEYFCDEDLVTPKWKARALVTKPSNFAEWALDEGLPDKFGDVKER